MDRPKVKLNINKKTATIEEGEDNFLGKMIKKVGKLTIKTPSGTRVITRVRTKKK